MRKTVIIIAVIIAVVALAIVVVPRFLDVNRYHGIVQAQLEKALGRRVAFGQMHLSLTPPKLVLDDVSIGEDREFGSGVFATIPELHAQVNVWPLLRGNVELVALRFQDPQLQLIRNAAGVWNFSSLGQTSKKAPSAGAGGGLTISNLEVANGQISVTDRTTNFRGVYRNIDLGVSGFGPGRAFDLSAGAKLPGSGNEQLKLEGKAGPLVPDNFARTPFDGKLQLDEVSLAGLAKVLNTQALCGIEGTASGAISLRNQAEVITSGGSLKLTDGKLRGVEIGYPISADYQLNYDLKTSAIRIDKGTIALGATPLSVTGTMNTGTPARVDLAIATHDASIAEAARLAAALGVAFSPGMNVSGQMTADLHATGPAASPQLSGKLTASRVNVSGGSLKQPVDIGDVQLTLTPASIQSSEFTASSGGTKLNAAFTLSGYSTPSPEIQARLQTANASLAELLGIARAYGVSAAEGISGSGGVTLNLTVSGPTKNLSALSFSGTGELEKASLKTPALTEPLNVQHATLQFARNSATLQNLAASLAGSNLTGTMTVHNFAAPDLQFTLAADKVNVAQLQQALGNPPQRTAAQHGWKLVPVADAAAPPKPGSALADVTGRGTATIGTVIYDQLQLTNAKADIALDHGLVRMSPVTATLYGGQQSGTILVDTRTTPMDIEVSSSLEKVDANQLISSLSSVKQTIYGLLAANAKTTFRANSSEDVAKTLNGTLSLDLSKGRIAHVDLLNQLASVGRFVTKSATPAQPFTDVTQLTGTFNIANGLAQTTDLKAVIPGGSLAGVGSINLASQGLDMHVVAVLGKELSQQVGGTQVGGMMQTVLANNKGELVIPVLVSGTLQSPRFAPDLQKLAQMKLQQMLPTANNPAAMTSGILGAILGQRGNQQGGAQQQPQGGLGGILGAISGQQQQQQQQQPQGQPPDQQQAQPGQQQPQQPASPLQQIMDAIKAKQQKQQPKPPPKKPGDPQ